jgi:hypothetical protein
MKEAKEGNSRVLVPVQNAEDRLLELWIQSPHTPVTQAEVGKTPWAARNWSKWR